MAETFNDWWGPYAAREFGADERCARIARSIALDTWVARQSEIDVLQRRNRELEHRLFGEDDDEGSSGCSVA